MSGAVVANAGPLMALAKLNLLHLLKQLYQAYHSSLITADQLRFYFGQIEERTDIWISLALCRRLLQKVLGET